MHRRILAALAALILVTLAFSAAQAQSDWWISGQRKGDKKNIPGNVRAGDEIVFGMYEKKQLVWSVLETDGTKALLFLDQDLFRRPYNPVMSKFLTWENSMLRKWLNGDFLSKAFTKEQRERIQLTRVDNSQKQHRNPDWATRDHPDTDDYVYLQESNEPTLYIKLSKEVFINRLNSVVTWRYE